MVQLNSLLSEFLAGATFNGASKVLGWVPLWCPQVLHALSIVALKIAPCDRMSLISISSVELIAKKGK